MSESALPLLLTDMNNDQTNCASAGPCSPDNGGAAHRQKGRRADSGAVYLSACRVFGTCYLRAAAHLREGRGADIDAVVGARLVHDCPVCEVICCWYCVLLSLHIAHLSAAGG